MDSQENWSKVKVTGQGHRGQINIKNDVLGCYLNNSKSYWPILMNFGRIVCNDKRNAKFDSQKIRSNVKVTGAKLPLKKWLFKLLPQLLNKIGTDLDYLWQDGV